MLLLTGSLCDAARPLAILPGAEEQAEGSALARARQEALKHLDMAALMGGPALRPALDVAIGRVQRDMRAAAGIAAGRTASPHEQRPGCETHAGPSGPDEVGSATAPDMVQASAKRQRTQGVTTASQLFQDATVNSPREKPPVEGQLTPPRLRHAGAHVAEPIAEPGKDAACVVTEDAWPNYSAFTASPPPGSLRSEPISTVELPSLERCGSSIPQKHAHVGSSSMLILTRLG